MSVWHSLSLRSVVYNLTSPSLDCLSVDHRDYSFLFCASLLCSCKVGKGLLCGLCPVWFSRRPVCTPIKGCLCCFSRHQALRPFRRSTDKERALLFPPMDVLMKTPRMYNECPSPTHKGLKMKFQIHWRIVEPNRLGDEPWKQKQGK